MNRVLVTGCWGFVGRVLIEMLQARGYEAWGTDLKGGVDEFPGKAYVPCDLQDERAVTHLLDEVHPGGVVHLAAQSSAGISFGEPLETIRNNVLPALHILEFLRIRSSETRLLVIGSAEEYGPVGAEDLPLAEDHPTCPVSPYALSKMIQGACSKSYASLYGVDIILTRSFNHSGRGQSDTFVLGSFARQIAEIEMGLREPVIEVGNLDVQRDFMDVRDASAAYIALLEKGRSGEVYNVCTGRAYRLRELLDTLCRIAGIDIEKRVARGRLRPLDTLELRGDPSKIEGETGWKAGIPIEETLGELLDYWRARIGRGQHGKTE